MSGFFAVRRSAVDPAALKPDGYKIMLEILVRGRDRAGHRDPVHLPAPGGRREQGQPSPGPAVPAPPCRAPAGRTRAVGSQLPRLRGGRRHRHRRELGHACRAHGPPGTAVPARLVPGHPGDDRLELRADRPPGHASAGTAGHCAGSAGSGCSAAARSRCTWPYWPSWCRRCRYRCCRPTFSLSGSCSCCATRPPAGGCTDATTMRATPWRGRRYAGCWAGCDARR